MALKPAEHALVKALDDGAIALNLNTGQYYSLNDTAARLWALLAEEISLAQILAAIEDEYEVDPQTVQEDINELVSELQEQGFLIEVPAAG